MKVYVGSLWHGDCDPFATVVANDYATCKAKLDEMSAEEYSRSIDDEPDYRDDITTSGVFQETLYTDWGVFALPSQVEEILNRLATDGYYIL